MNPEKQIPKDTDFQDIDGIHLTFLDIKTVVSRFYAQVAEDPLLKVPFSSVSDWPHHIDRLTHFWWMRFGGDQYMNATYHPALKHFEANFTRTLLTQWLTLFQKTLSEALSPEKATLWLNLATQMGEALNSKNEYLNQNQKK